MPSVPFVPPPDGYTIRHLLTHEERLEAVRIQEETWGDEVLVAKGWRVKVGPEGWRNKCS